uniref:Uncharacterized protein n=1 Tax=Anguilla anguilla TaxID=7936 RepID=A0A0E9X2D9_ANGAN
MAVLHSRIWPWGVPLIIFFEGRWQCIAQKKNYFLHKLSFAEQVRFKLRSSFSYAKSHETRISCNILNY